MTATMTDRDDVTSPLNDARNHPGNRPTAPSSAGGSIVDTFMRIEENDSDNDRVPKDTSTVPASTATATTTATATATTAANASSTKSNGDEHVPLKRSFYCTTSSVYAENTISNPNHEQISYWYVHAWVLGFLSKMKGK